MAISTSRKLTQVEINGVDVSQYVLRYEIKDTVEDDLVECNIDLVSDFATIFPSVDINQTIEIYRGYTTATDTKIFSGFVSEFTKNRPMVNVKGKDKMWKLATTEVTKSYQKNIDPEAGVISDIFLDLVTTFGELNADATSIEDSGTAVTLDIFFCDHDKILERCRALKRILDWHMFYRATTDKVNFQPVGFFDYPTTLEVGVNIANKPIWEYNSTQMINQCTVLGAVDEVETTETFDGDALETDFELDFAPKSVKVFVGGTLQSGGNEEDSDTADYYVRKEPGIQKVVFFIAPGVGVGNIEIRYSYFQPRAVIADDEDSIDAYNLKETTLTVDDFKTVDDVTEKTQAIVDTFKDPFVNTSLEVFEVTDIFAGYRVRVIDSPQNEDRSMVVREVSLRWPEQTDILRVGDKEWKLSEFIDQLESKVVALQKEKLRNVGKLLHLIRKTRTFKYRRRYMEVQKTELDLDNSFVLGHPDAGVLGTDILGKTTNTADVPVKIVQGQNTYKEYIYDTDFHDAVNSTATFSEVSGDIHFSQNEIWYSSAIDIGTTLSWITVTLGTTIGTLVIEISSDNKVSWETVTNATRTAVASSDGTGTYIRITATDVDAPLFGGGLGFPIIFGAGYITNTQDIYSRKTAPGISALMEE